MTPPALLLHLHMATTSHKSINVKLLVYLLFVTKLPHSHPPYNSIVISHNKKQYNNSNNDINSQDDDGEEDLMRRSVEDVEMSLGKIIRLRGYR